MAMFERMISNQWFVGATTIDSTLLLLDVRTVTDQKQVEARVPFPRAGLAPSTRAATCAAAITAIRRQLAEASALARYTLTPEPTDLN